VGVSLRVVSITFSEQIAKEPAGAPAVLVQRSLPTDPSVHGSKSLYLTEAERQGIQAERRMLHVGRDTPSGDVAAALRIPDGAPSFARRKLMSANGVPVRIATSWFRLDVAEDTPLAHPEFVLPSLQAAIEGMGHRFGRAEEKFIARRPTETEAQLLELNVDDPADMIVVQVIRASYSAEDVPMHILETICAASRHEFPVHQVGVGDTF
jgi:GntR family transcriptional regulator